MTERAKTLEERVMQFRMMELPGQPIMMHMGTSYLVNDLWQAHQEMRMALEGLLNDVYEIFSSPEQLQMAAELARKGQPAISADTDGPDTIKAARAALKNNP